MQSPKSDENIELKSDCVKDAQMSSPKLKGSPPKDLNKKQVQSKNSFQLIQEALDATSKSIEKLQQHKGKAQVNSTNQQPGDCSPVSNNSQNSSYSKDSGYSGPASIVDGSNSSGSQTAIVENHDQMTNKSFESKSSYGKKLRSRKNLKTTTKNGKPLKTVTFPDAEEDLVRVHYVQTYKRWNYRQYIYVCSHLSYFDRSDLEGIEDEMEERFGIDG